MHKKSPKAHRTSIHLLCGILIVGLFPITLDAAPETIDEKYQELQDLAKKEEKYRDLINLKDKEETIITKQVQQLEAQSATLEIDIQKNKEEIKEISSDITSVSQKIDTKSTAINLQIELLQSILRDRYQNLSFGQDLSALFPATSAQTFTANDRVGQTTGRMSDLVTLITEERSALESSKQELAEKKTAIKDAQFELEERNERLESSKNYKTVLAAQVSAEKSTYTNRLNKVLAEQLSIQSEIDSLSTTQIGNFSLADLPDKDDADLERPVKKPYVVTQGYGKTSFSHNYKGGHHNGVDYVAKDNKDILAAADGRVLATGDMGSYGYGKWVAVDHENGLVSLYGHLSKISTSKGKDVDQGDKIGTMGNTGFSTGPHLHFTLFAKSTFSVVASTSVKGVYIPTGGTINPALYL